MAKQHLISVLNKMIMKDLFKTLFGVLSVVVVIIVSWQFVKVLAKAIEGEVSSQTVLVILGLKMIVAAVKILPVALFISVLLVLGRMYREQEMSALASAGGGIGLLYRAVFMTIIPISFLALVFSMVVMPWAESSIQQIINRDKETADIRGISAGRFSEYSHGNLVFYVQETSKDGLMQNIFIQNRQDGEPGVITARSGYMKFTSGGRYLFLNDGQRILGFPGRVDFILENFDEFAIKVEIESQEVSFGLEAKPSKDLWHSTDIHDAAELQKRFGVPLSVLILAALAIPLAQISPRGGVYGNLLTAFLIYFGYSNLIKINGSLVVNGTIPLWAGYTGVYILMLLIVGLLVARMYGWSWVKLVLTGRNVL